MPNYLKETGRYRARITACGLHESDKTQALGIKYWCETISKLDSDQWITYGPDAVQGYHCLFDSKGVRLDDNWKYFQDSTGWDGDLVALAEGSWTPKDVQINVQSEPFNGREYFKINSIFPYDHEPRTGNVSASRAAELMKQYGLKAAKRPQSQAPTPRPEEDAAPPRDEPPAEAPPSTEDDPEMAAWRSFHARGRDKGMEDDEISTVWSQVVGKYERESDEITDTQWREIAVVNPKTWTPF